MGLISRFADGNRTGQAAAASSAAQAAIAGRPVHAEDRQFCWSRALGRCRQLALIDRWSGAAASKPPPPPAAPRRQPGRRMPPAPDAGAAAAQLLPNAPGTDLDAARPGQDHRPAHRHRRADRQAGALRHPHHHGALLLFHAGQRDAGDPAFVQIEDHRPDQPAPSGSFPAGCMPPAPASTAWSIRSMMSG